MAKLLSLISALVWAYVFGCEPASAAIVWDYGPTMGIVSDLGYSNAITTQHFAESILFAADVDVTGFNHFGRSDFVGTPSSYTFTLYADNSGQPGTIISQFTKTFDSQTTVIAPNSMGNVTAVEVTFNFSTPLHLTLAPRTGSVLLLRLVTRLRAALWRLATAQWLSSSGAHLPASPAGLSVIRCSS